MLVAVLATNVLLHVAGLEVRAVLACCTATDKATSTYNTAGATVAGVRASEGYQVLSTQLQGGSLL
jgi:hypothetical protein